MQALRKTNKGINLYLFPLVLDYNNYYFINPNVEL